MSKIVVMRAFSPLWTAILILALALVAVAQTVSTKAFRVERVASGVYAFLRNDPASFWFTPNNGLIVGKKYAIVIDSNITSEHTREVLAAIRKITDKPVKYVINTHWHEDHIIGNHVYREAFPGVKFIGQASMPDDLATTGLKNRNNSLKFAGGLVADLKKGLGTGKDLGGRPITDEARAGYSFDISIIEPYLSEAGSVPIVMPDVLVNDRMDVHEDGIDLSVRYLGRAHTAADLVVYLPRQKVAFTGDLTAWPIPLIGSTSFPVEYEESLKRLAALDIRQFIPGHGPVMRDRAYIDRMIELLDSIRSQVSKAMAEGKDLAATRKSVDLDGIRKTFCGDSDHRRFIWDNYVFQSGTAAAYNELKSEKQK